jgi:hypothetical protein
MRYLSKNLTKKRLKRSPRRKKRRKSRRPFVGGDDEEPDTCAICLGEFEEDDDIIRCQNGKCNNPYHYACIERWCLTQHNGCKCPLCQQPFPVYTKVIVTVVYWDGTYVGNIISRDGHYNNKDGRGTMTYVNGNIYQGHWKNDEKSGTGTMTYATGDMYKGNWTNSNKDGRGKMTYSNGNVYQGNWKDDEKFGTGTMTYATGDMYKGEWGNWYHRRGMKEGQGTMKYANGDRYEGTWSADSIHGGQGTMTYANGDVYQGGWSNNKKEDKEGRMRYANGDVYVGEWYNDVIDGLGFMTYANGDVYKGRWMNGVPDLRPTPPEIEELIQFIHDIDLEKIRVKKEDQYGNKRDYKLYIKSEEEYSLLRALTHCKENSTFYIHSRDGRISTVGGLIRGVEENLNFFDVSEEGGNQYTRGIKHTYKRFLTRFEELEKEQQVEANHVSSSASRKRSRSRSRKG